jgi:hypothetical protein
MRYKVLNPGVSLCAPGHEEEVFAVAPGNGESHVVLIAIHPMVFFIRLERKAKIIVYHRRYRCRQLPPAIGNSRINWISQHSAIIESYLAETVREKLAPHFESVASHQPMSAYG